jgi:hypothetical protein
LKGEKMLQSKSIKMIEVSDWDKLVKDTYGKVYSFQQQDDCKERGVFRFSVPVDKYEMEEQEEYMSSEIEEKVNGSEMGVKFEKWLERSPEQPLGEDKTQWMIDMFWERNFYPSVLTLINDLYEKGLIEEGEYGINIDW